MHHAQAEADGVVAHLQEQQRALAARERDAAGRQKQLALRWSGRLQGAGLSSSGQQLACSPGSK